MSKPDEIVTAANVLLTNVGASFGRVARNLHHTSSQLAAVCDRIRATKMSQRAP